MRANCHLHEAFSFCFFVDLKLISTVFRNCEEVKEELSSDLSLRILVDHCES